MNELTMYVIVALFGSAWVAYFACGLIKLWFRLDRYPLIEKLIKRADTDYFVLGLSFATISALTSLFCLLAYRNGGLHIVAFITISIVAIIFAPRFIIDVWRGLKYNAKTGELERLKEIERNK